ncbi:MAG: hypothetical protein ABSD31_00695 [Candidatus Binataceae bacterium]|jgi:hypothetical protein
MPSSLVRILVVASAITIAGGMLGCAASNRAADEQAEAAAARAEAAAARAEAAAAKTQEAADKTTVAADKAAAAAADATRSVNASSEHVDKLLAQDRANQTGVSQSKSAKKKAAKTASAKTASSADDGKGASPATESNPPN